MILWTSQRLSLVYINSKTWNQNLISKTQTLGLKQPTRTKLPSEVLPKGCITQPSWPPLYSPHPQVTNYPEEKCFVHWERFSLWASKTHWDRGPGETRLCFLRIRAMTSLEKHQTVSLACLPLEGRKSLNQQEADLPPTLKWTGPKETPQWGGSKSDRCSRLRTTSAISSRALVSKWLL